MKKYLEATMPHSCWNRAADDELVFVLLGRDTCAPVAIEAWCQQRILSGKNGSRDPQIEEAKMIATQMRRRQEASP